MTGAIKSEILNDSEVLIICDKRELSFDSQIKEWIYFDQLPGANTIHFTK